MGIDRTFLAKHAGFLSEGVEERAFHLPSGDGWCLAIAYVPAEVSPPGFVVCHSYGLEFTSLRRVERAVARTLARMGHPVIALHRRGFGDSSHDAEDASLDRSLEDIRSGIDWLSHEPGVTRAGLMGARSGALMAGTTARRGVAGPLILINPVTSGRTLVRQLVQRMNAVAAASTMDLPARSLDEVLEEMHRTGTVEAIGYVLTRDLLEPLLDVDLTTDMGAFHGDALILQVQKGTSIPRPVKALARRIEAAGGRSTVELIQEPTGTRFGYVPFASATDATVRVDVQQPMTEQIVAAVRRWMGG
jgi:pimeloyl-ACP methyl ester carboxylesterase